MRLNAIIVDDEKNSRIVLRKIIEEYVAGINIVGEAANVSEAKTEIDNLNPDLVFLDIEMPQQNGFELFAHFPNPDFKTIFITAYDEYAVQAFRIAAIDYLLKPVNPKELKIAVQKAFNQKVKEQKKQKLKILLDNLSNGFNKISLPTPGGFVFLDIKEIIRCKAENSNAVFYTKDKEILVTKSLKSYEDILSCFSFFRISRFDIVNLAKVVRFSKHKNPSVILEDGTELSVSEIRKKELLELLVK